MIPLANHLWQSTLFVAALWLLTLALRKNRAAVRYGLWLVASVKFLVPFSLLVTAGTQVGWRSTIAIPNPQPQISFVMDEIAQPFAVAPPAPSRAAVPIPVVRSCVWLSGFAIGVIFWFRRWRQIRAVLRAATPLPLKLPIPVLSSPARLEPGIFGILKPVLLLPAGITDRLTPDQLNAVIAHELSHVRRRDNLTAAIHMVVETVFWFHPLVWWIRERLVEERERACDEEVLRTSGDPHDYAEGILNVCKFYLESPLPCVSGITGSNLKKRIEEIMVPRITHNLDWWHKLLLAAAAAVAVAGPVVIGLVNAPPSRAQSQNSATLKFEVGSVKANKSGSDRGPSGGVMPGGRFTITNISLRELIVYAYDITPKLLEGGPSWLDSARYDIDAKPEAGAIPAGAHGRAVWDKTRLMLRTLLAERFQLAVRRETRELPIYELTIAKGGPKLQNSDADCSANLYACHGFAGSPVHLSGTGVDIADIADYLSGHTDRPVRDKTGIQGVFDIKMQWWPHSTPPPAELNDAPRSPAVEKREGPRPDFASLPTLDTALEQQLGLKLESRKGPVEVYVIDHVERPSEN